MVSSNGGRRSSARIVRTATPVAVPVAGGLALIVATLGPAGCIQPTTDQPWSTKSASLPASGDRGESRAEADEVEASSDAPVLLVPMGDPVVVSSSTRSPSPQPAPPPSRPVVASAPPREAVEAEPPAETPIPAIVQGATPESRARSIVEASIERPNALERAYAYEAMQHAPDLLLVHGGRGVVDENRGVRFVATMAIGRSGLGRLASVLHPGLLDESDSVRAATIFALRSLGEGVDPSPLAAMVASDDPEIRGNATMVLGMLGNPSAVPVIQSSLGRGMRLQNPMRVRITELQAAETLVQLGREEDIEPIRAALFAPVEQGELTVLACDILGRLEDQQARPMLMRLLLAEGNQRRPPEIRVAAAGAIFRLPPPFEPGLEEVMLEQVRADDPRLRTQVAAALRFVPGEAASKSLDRMLADTDPLVRIAAAGAILARADTTGAATAVVPD